MSAVRRIARGARHPPVPAPHRHRPSPRRHRHGPPVRPENRSPATVVLQRPARWSFRGADLRGASLRGVSLRGVSLAGCDLTGVDHREADLTGARIGRVRTGIPPHGLTDATGIRLDNAVLRAIELDLVIGWPLTT
ncbi:pentapeptide repeat-containing protein [Kitasatospora sp. NPDC057015]|uniref:pentapeptide repeat-containing protein n=1 Tax=Kitasatospora sp. NPDC057015 TaxID=3346001 RepID=UPI00363B0BF3